MVPRLIKSPAWLVPLIMGLIMTILILDVLSPIGIIYPMLFVLPVYLAGWLAQRWALPLTAIIATLLVPIGGIFSPPGGVLMIVWTNRLLAILTIWLTVAISLTQRRLAAEIKSLRGLLPICASCKKIRDEQGRWHPLELFVRDHSEAEFTHGLCPACLETYSAELTERART